MIVGAKDPFSIEDRFSIDEIAKLLGLPDSEKVEDGNLDHVADIGVVAYEATIDGDEDAAEAAQSEAEQKAIGVIYSSWHTAVLHAATELFERHGLTLDPVTEDPHPYEYRVVPSAVTGKRRLPDWKSSVNEIRKTINGVGVFEFKDLQEFLKSGPYTARRAVLRHLHWIRRYPDVYGTTSAQRLYEQAWK